MSQEDEDHSYETAVKSLLSPLHQATTKEEIAKSAARRTQTVTDMRHYWKLMDCHKVLPKRVIHITGTKGKGSTACMCEAILRAHGYSTGLFTSPHLIDIRERIRWNGKPIHSNLFAQIYWKIRNSLEEAKGDSMPEELPRLPGYFRYLTLMAYLTFAQLQVDVMIIEVGMGGRYDATNFVDFIDCKVACGVTLLDYDHTRILGNTLEQIAWEKGGIFAIHDKASTSNLSPKPVPQTKEEKADGGSETATQDAKRQKTSSKDEQAGTANANFFILDSNSSGVMHMFRQCAQIEGRGTSLTPVDATGSELRKQLGYESLGLAGRHQYGNATLAVHLCRSITDDNQSEDEKRISCSNPTTLQALKDASWPARCQTVQRGEVHFRLDGAHTLQSLEATIEWFVQNRRSSIPCILVFNTSHERNPVELLQKLQPIGFEKIYFAKSNSSRPSPVKIPTAQELLKANGITTITSSSDNDDKPSETWQETLGLIWKHIQETSSNDDDDDKNKAVEVACNMTATEVLADLSNLQGPLEVLVTGSLYLVGSFLTAIDWSEESSPDYELK